MSTLVPHSPNVRLLLLDQDATVLALLPEAIQLRLGEMEFDYTTAPVAALERLVLCRYNLVIADVRHAAPSQAAFVAALREAARDTPLLLTSVTDRELIGRLCEMERVHYLPKPFDREELISVIRRVMVASASCEQSTSVTGTGASLAQG